MTTSTRTIWQRVCSDNPCRTCGKPDWCLYSPDGITICARVESNHKAGNAGWLHKPTDNRPVYIPQVKEKSVSQLPRASLERLNTVYLAMIKVLTLSTRHAEHLRARGLTSEQIELLQYRTLPLDGRGEIVRQIQGQGLKLAGIPGFWLSDDEVRLAGAPGILISVKDIKGRIQGLQIRADNPTSGK